MAFSESEVARHLQDIETHFWAKRRPPLNLRDKIREGQRIAGQSVELFYMRPGWRDPSEWHEESIAKATYVRSRRVWRVYWKRADLRWHPYPEGREVDSLRAFLRLVDEDKFACFFG